MPLEYNNDDGAQALDQQQELDFRRGWQVVDAASGSNVVTDGAGAFEVDVAAGDINTPSGTVSCSAATLDLQSFVDPDLPRIVIVYRDGSGAAQTLVGTPAEKQPAGEATPGGLYQPVPDAFSATDGVVLATVLLEAAAASVGSGQIRDRRMPASINVSSAEVRSLSTTQSFTESRAADVIIRDDGTNIIADGPNEEITQNSDLGVVIDDLLTWHANNSRRGTDVYISQGIYEADTEPSSDWPDGFNVRGVRGGGSFISVTSAIDSLFPVQQVGSTVRKAPKISNLQVINGNNLNDGLIKLDSAVNGEISGIILDDGGRIVYSKVDENVKNCEHWEVRNCRGRAGGKIAKLEAGSAGTFDLFHFENCYSFGLDGWAFEFVDGIASVNHVGAFNNSSTFNGVVRVANPDTASGANTPVGLELSNIFIENQDGTNAAVGVRIEAPSGTGTQQKNHKIEDLEFVPANSITAVEFVNNSSTANRIASSQVRGFKIDPTHSNALVVGSGVANVKIESQGMAGSGVSDIRSFTNDSGTRTAFNGNLFEPTGGAPDATNFETGQIVHDTNNSGDAYLVYDASVSGGVTQIGT